ncbi:MAG: cysteine-rich CWC family protein [Ferruginibacter sp.]|nr:cysteine-rich CWC family protein [Ferruginibacter sp.]
MCLHEEKHCPRCNIAFECKAGTITQCQCSAIRLSAEESAFIQSKYDDCLCINCLRDLQKNYSHFKTKYILKK